MTDEEVATALDAMDDDQLLQALNRTLVKRQKPATEAELDDAAYAEYYPSKGGPR